MTTENRRLLIAIDAEIREINRQTINPLFKELKLADLTPVIEMVAKARANYLRTLYDIAHQAPDGQPSESDIKRLTGLRLVYEELVKGSQALETAIEREYLDVSR
ncbi:hypothetical protein [Thermochromatium tepidum]|jgi:hypothetical protein|uniref:Uncharacterized protein n=1 Tax=Thermochromatium tepidum ATCC 43061 TaxID=316276 RepID=A0A6I6EBT8_THETI|nr:hypothetical protein [Thermochromatium tepidum]QGU31620.1 hypothetical protein E6P07_00585 [Thermochromatium tepidum ATCC 43061]